MIKTENKNTLDYSEQIENDIYNSILDFLNNDIYQIIDDIIGKKDENKIISQLKNIIIIINSLKKDILDNPKSLRYWDGYHCPPTRGWSCQWRP